MVAVPKPQNQERPTLTLGDTFNVLTSGQIKQMSHADKLRVLGTTASYAAAQAKDAMDASALRGDPAGRKQHQHFKNKFNESLKVVRRNEVGDEYL